MLSLITLSVTRTTPWREYMPPPPLFAKLPLIVLSLTVKWPWGKIAMPPPRDSVTQLLLIVQRVIVTVCDPP